MDEEHDDDVTVPRRGRFPRDRVEAERADRFTFGHRTGSARVQRAFDEIGFCTVPGVLTPGESDAISARLERLGHMGPGTRRMLELPWVKALAKDLRENSALSAIIPKDYSAVQCTLFAKSRETNWAVAPHQDLSIPVASRVEHSNLTGWSEKEGMLFVQPPAHVLAQLVAVRVHVDDCGLNAGALRVFPGSHRRRAFSQEEIHLLQAIMEEVHCAAPQGGAMALRPLLVHASSKTAVSSPRRVLHFLLGPRELQFGLRWAHAV